MNRSTSALALAAFLAAPILPAMADLFRHGDGVYADSYGATVTIDDSTLVAPGAGKYAEPVKILIKMMEKWL